jgi:hypothetical protein
VNIEPRTNNKPIQGADAANPRERQASLIYLSVFAGSLSRFARQKLTAAENIPSAIKCRSRVNTQLTDSRFTLEISTRHDFETTHRLNRSHELSFQVNLASRDVSVDCGIGADHQELAGFDLTGEMPIDFNRQIVAKLSGDRRVREQYRAWRRPLNE